MNPVTIDAAMSYVEEGWRIFPLSPGSREPWPRWTGWQTDNNASVAHQVIDMFGGVREGAGIGIVTGAVSGIWVLDLDQKHGHDGAASLRFLEAIHGALPATYTVATPSGGRHLYWAMPPDFEVPNSAGKLGDGIDTRGRGGYVGAPPSVVALEDGTAGRYVVISAPGTKVAKAPDWLVDMLRPVERGSVAGPVALDALSAGRLRSYLEGAIPGLLDELHFAVSGQRNTTAHRVAARLWEYVNAGWLAQDTARALYDGAATVCEARTGDGGFQADTAWWSGQRTVAGKAAIMPDIGSTGVEEWPHLAAPAGPVRDFTSAATAEPVVVAAAPTVDPVAAWREQQVEREYERLRARREAERRLVAAPTIDWLAAGKGIEEVEAAEPYVALVAGWLFLDTIARVYGPSGHGKSFAVLDWSMSVALGRPWHGAKVEAGAVAYVAGEGARGIGVRTAAWRARYGVERAELAGKFWLFDVMPSPADELAWRAFVGAMMVRQVKLIVFDTQALLTDGLDENSKIDMDVMVRALKYLRAMTGACVLVVHHSGKNESAGGRGHSSVKAALETEIEVRRSGTTVTITSVKQKDAADPPARTAQLTEVPGAGSSVLVFAGDEGTLGGLPPLDDGGNTRDLAKVRALLLVDLLRQLAGEGEGVTEAELSRAFRELPELASVGRTSRYGTFRTALGRLDELGRLGRTSGAKVAYREIDGLDDLAPAPDAGLGFGRPLMGKDEQTKTKRQKRAIQGVGGGVGGRPQDHPRTPVSEVFPTSDTPPTL